MLQPTPQANAAQSLPEPQPPFGVPPEARSGVSGSDGAGSDGADSDLADAAMTDAGDAPVEPFPTDSTIDAGGAKEPSPAAGVQVGAAAGPSPPSDPAIEPNLRAGERLRRARLSAGLSLDAVSDQLRINRVYLAALEDMNVKMLPGKAYALPYLRSYARMLGLDAEGMLRQFQAESALSREDATPQIRNPDSKPERERPWIWALALVLVAGGFVTYRALFAPPHGAETATKPTVTAVAGAPRPVAPSVEGDGLPFGVAAQRVEIRAITPAWLEVRTPGGTVMLSQELGAGQVYQVETGAGWMLHARDGGAFEVFLNGALVGALGQPGAPVLGRQVDGIAAAALKAPTDAGAQVSAGVAPLPGPSIMATPLPGAVQAAAPNGVSPAPGTPSVMLGSAPSPMTVSVTPPAVERPRPPRPPRPRPAPRAADPNAAYVPPSAAPAAPAAATPEPWEAGAGPPPPTPPAT